MTDVQGVGKTAVAVAAARALEATRPDALVRDPWAAALVRASGITFPYPATWPDDVSAVPPLEHALLLGSMYIGMRTRFIDDALQAARREQVVILGSGLDTRSWRLAWPPDAVVFELDEAEVLDLVASALQAAGATATARRVPVVADVTEPWAAKIVAHGFRPATPTHWVLEGLLPYLSAHDQGALLDDIVHLSAPGSHVVIERAPAIEDTPETRARLQEFAAATGVPLDDVLARADPPDPMDVLTAAGWVAESIPITALEQRYQRLIRPEGAASNADSSRAGFVTAWLPARGGTAAG